MTTTKRNLQKRETANDKERLSRSEAGRRGAEARWGRSRENTTSAHTKERTDSRLNRELADRDQPRRRLSGESTRWESTNKDLGKELNRRIVNEDINRSRREDYRGRADSDREYYSRRLSLRDAIRRDIEERLGRELEEIAAEEFRQLIQDEAERRGIEIRWIRDYDQKYARNWNNIDLEDEYEEEEDIEELLSEIPRGVQVRLGFGYAEEEEGDNEELVLRNDALRSRRQELEIQERANKQKPSTSRRASQPRYY